VTVPLVPLHGERLAVPERMIVAPGVGVFSPVEIDEGSAVEQGDVVGEIVGPGTRVAIRSPFRGTVMGMMAHPGERLREGQPIAWLRVA
jgi:[acyl-carrier-protein] S-malonyltransferase